MDDPEKHIRTVRHNLPVTHAEAFQLMRYDRRDGEPGSVWFWNSRDGVTPFGTMVDGVEYNHAMGKYVPSFWAMLPNLAGYVWVTYDRAAWADMARKRWERFKALPKGEYHDPAEFLTRYPDPESFVAIIEFEYGQPRQLSREEFLATTPEWMGRPEA